METHLVKDVHKVMIVKHAPDFLPQSAYPYHVNFMLYELSKGHSDLLGEITG